MPAKTDPGRLLYPGLTGRVIVDTWRGKVRVRKWPKKRGRPKSAAVRLQNDWFAKANRLAIRAPGSQMATAIEITHGSGLYPRDILIRMMAGNFGPIPLSDGRILTKASKRIEPVSFQGASLELATPFALVAGVSVQIPWPTPIRDTAGFWNPGAPGLLTIPNGVTLVQLRAMAMAIASGVHSLFFQIRYNGVLKVLSGSNGTNANTGTLVTGPIPVIAGDTFDTFVSTSLASTLNANGPTFLSLDVLEAT